MWKIGRNYANNNKLYIKPITIELVEKLFKKTHENQKNKEFVFYTSELGAIEIKCKFWLNLNNKHKQAKYILNLFDKLHYIRKVIQFIKLKKHHIEIGYSLMSKETYNLNDKRNAEIKTNQNEFKTYEEAELACLNKLIEIFKNENITLVR